MILGPISFNIFLSELFLNISYVKLACYADNNTIYDSRDSIDGFITSFEIQLFHWFSDNCIKGNNVRCHFIASANDTHYVFGGNSSIKSNSCKSLLGVKTDSRLNFDDHIKDTCKKANEKLKPLARATPFIKTEKKRKRS